MATLSVADVNVTEGTGGSNNATFTLTLDSTVGSDVIVGYTTSAGTASAGSDFTTTTGSATIASGLTTTTVNVPIATDSLFEDDETFTLNLLSISGASYSDSVGVGTIINDDTAPAASINSLSVTEGTGGSVTAVFTVSLNTASGRYVSLTYSTAPGTAGANVDYYTASGGVSIAAGNTTATINVLIATDSMYEPDETFSVSLSTFTGSGATLGTAVGTGTILNDDSSPTLSISSPSVSEGGSAFFVVTVNPVTYQDVTVTYSTSNGTATTADSDYTSTSGTVTIPAGTPSANFNVATGGDSVYEADETFSVTLSNPINAALGTGTSVGVGTILNNDPVLVSINNISVTEGTGGSSSAVFTVSIPAPTSVNVVVTCNTSAGTATSGTDYTSATSTVTIPAGQTTTTFSVALATDSLFEADETFGALLSSASGASIGVGTGIATILNDDAAPVASINGVSVTEGTGGASSAVFTVTLNAASSRDVVLNYATRPQTASASTDYTATSGSVSIAAGSTTATIVVSVATDDDYEPDETFDVSLSTISTSSATLGTAIGVGTIGNDDAAPMLNVVASGNTDENDLGGATFTFTLDEPVIQSTTVNFSLSGGATPGEDFYFFGPGADGTVVIPPGNTSATITLIPVNDAGEESLQDVSVTIESGNYEPDSGASTADVEIEDNEEYLSTYSYFLNQAMLSNGGGCICTGGLQVDNWNSAVNPHPIVAHNVTFESGVMAATSIEVELTFGSLVQDPVFYDPTSIVAGEPLRIAIEVDATSLSTGRYDWSLVVTEHYSGSDDVVNAYEGYQDVKNYINSEYGNRRSNPDLDRLRLYSTGALLVSGGQSTSWFVKDMANGHYFRTNGEMGFSTLEYNSGNSTYTVTSSHGEQSNFNSLGLLISKFDSRGNKTEYEYADEDTDSVVDELHSIKDPAGRTTTYGYTSGKVTTITDFAGRVTTYGYTSDVLTTVTETDPDGGGPLLAPQTTYTYDGTTKLMTSMTNAEGEVTTYTYHDDDRTLESITYPDGTIELFDAAIRRGVLIPGETHGSISSPADFIVAADIVTQFTDRAQEETSIRDGGIGLPLEVTDALGNVTRYIRDQDGHTVAMFTPDPDDDGPLGPMATYYHYDDKGNLDFQYNPDGTFRSWTYDVTWNKPLSITDELGHVTIYTLDSETGDVLTERRVVGANDLDSLEEDDVVTTYTYTPESESEGDPPAGLLASVTDALEVTTLYEYDEHGLLILVTYASETEAEGTVVYAYNEDQLLETMTDELGRVTTYAYDALGRMTNMTLPDPDGPGPESSPVYSYEYDRLGRLRKEYDPLDRLTEYVYNSAGQLIKKLTPALDIDLLPEPWAVYELDGDGSDATENGPTLDDTYGAFVAGLMGSATPSHVGTDSGDRPDVSGDLSIGFWLYLSPENLADYGGGQAFVGDGTSFLLIHAGVTGPSTVTVQVQGNTSHYEEIELSTGWHYFGVARASNVATIYVDGVAIGTPTNIGTAFADDNIQIGTEESGNGELIDQVSIFESALDAAAWKRLYQNGRGREYPDWNRTIVTYGFDDAGRQDEVIDALGNSYATVFDEVGRVTEQRTPSPLGIGTGPVQSTFGALGWVLTTTDPLENVTDYVYENFGRKVTMVRPDPISGDEGAGPTTSKEYDAVGNLIRTTDGRGFTTTYTYDELNRLTAVIYPDPSDDDINNPPVIQYGYDKLGRRTSVIDPLLNETTYEYDERGRLRLVTEPNPSTGAATGPETEYLYDTAGQLTSMIDAAGVVTEYFYDDLGRSVRTVVRDPDGRVRQPWAVYELDSDGDDAVGNGPTLSLSFGNYDTGFLDDGLEQESCLSAATPPGFDLGEFAVGLWFYVDSGFQASLDGPQTVVSIVRDGLGFTFGVQSTGAGLTVDLDGSSTLSFEDSLTTGWHHFAASVHEGTGTIFVDGIATAVDDIAPFTTSGDLIMIEVGGDAVMMADQVTLAGVAYTADEWAYIVNAGAGRAYDVWDIALVGDRNTYRSYDAVSNLLTETDSLGHTTTYAYDAHDNVASIVDALAGETTFTYDDLGNRLSLTDPEDNTTTWEYDYVSRVITETNELNDARSFEYDLAGNLIRKTDRLDRVTEYVYDHLHRRTTELWKDGVTTIRTLSYSHNDADQLDGASDPTASYTYDLDPLGRATSITADLDGLTPNVVFTLDFDSGSNRTGLSAMIGSTKDFANAYQYDRRNRMTRVTQSGQGGGNTVAEKRVGFTYTDLSQFDTVTRYADTAGTELVATTTFGYDGVNRLASILHAKGGTTLAGYDYLYDLADRITSIDSYLDDVSTYDYDDTNQLTAADHDSETDEAYEYDDNGNRIMAGHDIDPNNRLMSDGVYYYEYDAEGNRTAKQTIATGERVEYDWDYRNRLTKVTFKNSIGTVVKTVDQSYDVFNRWVRSVYDSNGATSGGVSERFFVNDGNQIVLEFDGDSGSDVSHRYLWGLAVDEILADEQVTSTGSAGMLIWPLTDHLGTARDLATHNSTTHVTIVDNHRFYDSFGNLKDESNDTVDLLFGFTGRAYDDNSELQNNLHRWLDPLTGFWISEDPAGFYAQDDNLRRYTHNSPLSSSDPNGLFQQFNPNYPYPNPYYPYPNPYPYDPFNPYPRPGVIAPPPTIFPPPNYVPGAGLRPPPSPNPTWTPPEDQSKAAGGLQMPRPLFECEDKAGWRPVQGRDPYPGSPIQRPIPAPLPPSYNDPPPAAPGGGGGSPPPLGGSGGYLPLPAPGGGGGSLPPLGGSGGYLPLPAPGGGGGSLPPAAPVGGRPRR